MRWSTASLVVLLLAAAPTARAGIPVFSAVEVAINTLKATYTKIKASAAVIKTVQMLEEVANLYQTYQNARDMYASIGRVGRTVQGFGSRFRRALDTWNRPITWNNLGRTLNAWGIRPANTGPLGEVNQTMEEMNRDINRFNYSVRSAPQAMGRDRFMRNVVRGAKQNAATGELDLSTVAAVEASGAAADYAGGDLAREMAVWESQRVAQWEGLRDMEEAMLVHAGSEDEVNRLVLQQQMATVTLKRSQVTLATQEQEAAIAMADVIQRKAMAEHWAFKRRRETLQAEIGMAMSPP